MESLHRRETVEEVGKSFQRFGLIDYIVFIGMLVGCSGIGLYYALRSRKNVTSSEVDEYLMGGRNMSVIPISLSLIASYISGITLLGTPTETYLYGTEYMFIVLSIVFSAVIGNIIALPVFHELQLSSTYEYLRRRYGLKVQMMGSVLYFIGLTCWLPIVIYMPALSFNQVTGVNVHIVTPLVCIICIFYTSVGGLKAVVWTDVIQSVIMFGAMILIIVKGTMEIGGFYEVWNRNYESGRLEVPKFTLDPTVRHSMLSIGIGGSIYYSQTVFTSQDMVQRFLTLPTLRQARISSWIFVIGAACLVLICGYTGLLAYATYHACDPLTTGLAQAKDQVVPLLVMKIMGDYPGMPGLFVAGVFSAALSSLSTGLNSMSAVFLQDFVKGNRPKPLSEKATRYILRIVVVVFGTICVALVFIVEHLGTVLQLTWSLSAITSGPGTGIFVGGMLLPWFNEKGALWGALISLTLNALLIIGSQRAQAQGTAASLVKPTSVAGCDYSFTTPFHNITQPSEPAEEIFTLYRISYLYYTLLGASITIIIGSIISYFTRNTDKPPLDRRLFSPFVRRWLKSSKQLENEMLPPYR